MTFVFQPWMKTTLIAIGIVVLIAVIVFLYLLVAGADESCGKVIPVFDGEIMIPGEEVSLI